MIDIAAYGAHPDDLELAIGGTIAAHVDKGFRVVGIDLTRGEKGSNGTPQLRAKEAAEAAEVLGLWQRHNLGLPDLGVKLDDDQLAVVVESIRQLRPKLILSPYWFSHHPDHENAGSLLRKAFFVSGLKNFVTKSPPYRAERIFYFALPQHVNPTLIVDISDYFQKKLEAIEKYESQFSREGKAFPTNINAPGFWKRIESGNLYWGRQAGAIYGEPFYSPRAPLVPDLFWGEKENNQ